MDDNYKTPLISRTIEMAARNLDLPEDAVFHSDRGSNYTSAEFAGVLKGLGITQSVGRTGICYDNALSESVNGTLKNELVYRTAYISRKAAMDDIARWIELRYNRTRLSMGVGEVWCDVGLERFTDRFCNTSATCGAYRRRCSERYQRQSCNIYDTPTAIGEDCPLPLPARFKRMHPMPDLRPERSTATQRSGTGHRRKSWTST